LPISLLCGPARLAPKLWFRAADVLSKAYSLRVERGDHHITEEHLADTIELLLATRHRVPVSEEAPVTA